MVPYTKTNTHFWSYLAHLFLEWKIFQTNVIEELETHILSSVTLFLENRAFLWDKVEKYCRTGQVADDNMAHARYVLAT